MKLKQYNVTDSRPAGNNKIQGVTSITLAPSWIRTPNWSWALNSQPQERQYRLGEDHARTVTVV